MIAPWMRSRADIGTRVAPAPAGRRLAPVCVVLAGALVAIALGGVAAGAQRAVPASSTPVCATAGLVIWLESEPGGGTAGSVFYRLELTNLSGRTCTLRGYAGVSAVDLHGRQLGAAATREAARAPLAVTLVNGRTATARLRIVDAGALPACGVVTAAGLRVYPPGQRTAKVVPFPFQACSRSGQTVLAVGPLASS